MEAICVKCGNEYRCKKNGVSIEYNRNGAAVYYRSADLYQCPSCGHEIILGIADTPAKEPSTIPLVVIHV